MVCTNKTLHTLEYDKIIDMLAGYAATEGARKRALSLLPSDDPETVRRRQEYTTDARRLLAVKGTPGFSADEGVPAAAERADKGASLSAAELLRIATLLRCARKLLDYLHTDKLFETGLDLIFDRLVPNRYLEERISHSILTEDTIADEASPQLADIRRKMKAANQRIKDILQSFTASGRSRYLQDNVVTMRGGRYVIPVKAEYRNEIKGLVHDTSASGATVFIEPMAVVEANNELRELESREQNEIERILAELSAECGACCATIQNDYYVITELSFYFACAALADAMKATSPQLTGKPYIELHRARHPLIDRAKVVPIDVTLGGDYDTLIITGPNTGGKTVTLKTLGLLTLMTCAGLHIPADEHSVVGLFGEVLVDIGDEQSIEQSLSTFSSHMVNIVSLLGQAGERSLVLFDELGAGTDPVEGAALAVAILDHVRSLGAHCAATTHYAELKAYALDTPGVQNASCEFDLQTLRPTYRLIVGAPGKSNAFAISERLGLPAEVVARAQALVSGENRRFENVIEKLEVSRREMERERETAERLRREFEAYKQQAEARLQEKVRESEATIEKEREKARRMVDSARINSEYVFKELEQIRRRQESTRFAEELAAARKNVREKLRQSQEVYDAFDYRDVSLEEEYRPSHPFRVGDKVYLTAYHQPGTITALPDAKGLYGVNAGILKARVPGSDLRLMEDMKKNERSTTGKRIVKPAPPAATAAPSVSDFRIELDVRGLYAEDACDKVDKYLDEAVLAGVSSVRIIHGKGTGALRKAIWQQLKGDSRVRSFRLGNIGEGDSGVTVVSF